MTASTFRGWGYSGKWVIDEGKDFPRLVWEGLAGDFIIDASNRYSEGSGEPNNPYRIRTPEDFIEIGYYPGAWDKSFVLTNNLDLNDVDPNLIFPIGIYGLPFLGVFDGNNYTISNFKYPFQKESYLGVFGSVGLDISTLRYDPDVQESQGIIQNLNLENVNISGFCYVGGLAGVSNGIISNCSVNGSITAALEDAGGLSGYNTGEIIDCTSNCTITAQSVAGALIGYNEGPVTACSCEGNVETDLNSSYSCTGGLIGNNYNIVESCHFSGSVAGSIRTGGLIGLNAGDIINCSAKGDVTGTQEVGGLIGQNGYNKNISRSFSNSIVTGDNRVGGLVGYNSGRIMNCYTVGCVDGKEYVAGLVGGGSNRFIANCYTSNIITGQENTAGFLGDYYRSSEIISCFWDTDISGLIDGVAEREPDPEGVIGLNTTQMQTESTYTDAGWDFVGETVNGTDDIWWIDEGEDYPRLWWELPSEQ